MSDFKARLDEVMAREVPFKTRLGATVAHLNEAYKQQIICWDGLSESLEAVLGVDWVEARGNRVITMAMLRRAGVNFRLICYALPVLGEVGQRVVEQLYADLRYINGQLERTPGWQVDVADLRAEAWDFHRWAWNHDLSENWDDTNRLLYRLLARYGTKGGK